MKKNSFTPIISLLIAVPILALLNSGLFICLYDGINQMKQTGLVPTLVFWFGCINAGMLLLLFYLLIRKNDKYINTSNKLDDVSSTFEQLMRDRNILQSKLESLSIIREISLIINDAVDFEEIWDKVLAYISELVIGGSNVRIAIFSLDDDNKKVNPVGYFENGKSFFEGKLNKIQISDFRVNEVLKEKRSFISYDGITADITLPLIADRDVVGAMKVMVDFDNDNADVSDALETIEENLLNAAKIISLSIKTPDLYTRAVKDGMTKLYTKRHFFNQIQFRIAEFLRDGMPFALIMFDIDHFKSINDTYGHLTGDIVLKKVSSIILSSIRATTEAFRYGGEELAVLLQSATVEDARVVADRLRKKIGKEKYIAENGKPIKITVSAGCAQWEEDMNLPEALISKADKSLYKAKESGRNRVV